MPKGGSKGGGGKKGGSLAKATDQTKASGKPNVGKGGKKGK